MAGVTGADAPRQAATGGRSRPLGWGPGKRVPRAMTVAGSDSGGGAGIQADLKTFAARGVYGTSAITALTAQNTLGVQGVFGVNPEFIAQQIDSIMEDIGADAWKIGMLANVPVIQVVARQVRKYAVDRLVVDPVMVAKGGAPLLEPEAQTALIEELLPLAYVVTPNLPEAEALTGMTIDSLEAMKEAARAIKAMGPHNVVITGGHLADAQAVDFLYDGSDFTQFTASRVDTPNTHGTGCTFAAAIAAELAWGRTLPEAVASAKDYLSKAIAAGADLDIGGGHGPVDHFHHWR